MRHFGSTAVALLALLCLSLVSSGSAEAQPMRMICNNAITGGTPNRFEIDLSRKTILEFEGDGSADDPITPDDTKAPLTVTKSSLRWSDPVDGQKYTLQRATLVLNKWLADGTPLYTKTCKSWPGKAWK